MEYTHVRHADSLGITLPFGAATWTPGFNDTWQPVFRENIADLKVVARHSPSLTELWKCGPWCFLPNQWNTLFRSMSIFYISYVFGNSTSKHYWFCAVNPCLHLVMIKYSRFWTDNYVKLINAGRILDNSKTLPESLVLIRDIVMPNVFDLCGLSFTDKHYQLLYTQKSPWTEILPSLSRWSILQYKFDLLLL